MESGGDKIDAVVVNCPVWMTSNAIMQMNRKSSWNHLSGFHSGKLIAATKL